MLKLRKIAITGGVASGKTSVCGFFKKLGAYVVEADAIVHELLTPETDLGKQVIQNLGHEILEDGKISRRRVAEKVFSSKEKLQELELLIHPRVFAKVEELYRSACSKERYTFFVVEIPLLFEIGKEAFFDTTILVVADEEKAKERFGSRSDYERRMQRQMCPKEKAKKASYVIKNNGTLEELQEKVVQLNQILQLKK